MKHVNFFSAKTNPCNPSPCGKGAKCEHTSRGAVCSCPRKTTGNPFLECCKIN